MLRRTLSVGALMVATSHVAFAQEPVLRLGSGLPFYPIADEGDVLESVSPLTTRSNTYQIGDEWGKHPVSNGDLAQTPHLLRAAQATAALGGATAFYLGSFNGEAVLATNHHVCPSMTACLGKEARFPLLGTAVKVTKSLGSWTDIDLSLVVVDVKPGDQERLDAVASNFDFESPIRPGQRLFTAGFGVANNMLHRLVANQDQDCIVFSKEGEYRKMFDPDRLNPGTYSTWSFANGCDVSHGDSGSAMVDRDTGKPVGLIWTGKIPKSAVVNSSERLSGLVGSDNPEVWTELSYAVPAEKIREYLLGLMQDGALSDDAAATVGAVVEADSVL